MSLQSLRSMEQVYLWRVFEPYLGESSSLGIKDPGGRTSEITYKLLESWSNSKQQDGANCGNARGIRS